MPPTDGQGWYEVVAQKVDTLTEPQAAALRLVYTDGLRQGEAAALMGLTPHEFSSVVAQGLGRLGQLMVYHALAAQIMQCQPAEQPDDPQTLPQSHLAARSCWAQTPEIGSTITVLLPSPPNPSSAPVRTEITNAAARWT